MAYDGFNEEMDAAAELGRNPADARDKIRERISQERRVLKECENRAAMLKSEAAVRALKAKRGARRRGANRQARPALSTVNPGEPRTDADTTAVSETAIDSATVDSSEEVCRAQARADEADAIVKGLRRGLGLRDEVLASAEAGNLYEVVTKAQECLSELGALQILLRQATPAAFDGGPPPFTITDDPCGKRGGGGSHSVEGGQNHGCSDAHGHGRLHSDARSHARAHPQLKRNVNVHGDREKAVCCSDQRPSEAGEDALVGAVEVLRSVTVAVRITEGNCLLRAGRAAQATEALRDLVLEHPTSVQAWTTRGRAFLSMQNHLLAELHFDRALKLDPDCADATDLKKSLRFRPETPEDGGPGVEAGESRHFLSKCFPNREVHGRTDPGGMAGDYGERSGAPQQETFRRFLAAACEEYRSGMVLHREAFFASSRDKFYRVLSLINEAEGAARGPAQTVEGGEEPVASLGSGSFQVPGSVEGEHDCAPATGCASRDSHANLDEIRVGCHLNIAAAALLRKTDYESVVHHCTRALTILRGNSSSSSRANLRRALVRRAQAHGELGRFRLAVDDLEAAEASFLGETREVSLQKENKGPVKTTLDGELGDIRKRLERARWAKIHVGNGKDELPGVTGS